MQDALEGTRVVAQRRGMALVVVVLEQGVSAASPKIRLCVLSYTSAWAISVHVSVLLAFRRMPPTGGGRRRRAQA